MKGGTAAHRRRWRARAALCVLAAVVAAALGACTGGTPRRGDEPRGTVVITTGSSGGVYYGWASALAEQVQRSHPDLKVRVVGSSGSVENLTRVTSGDADFALTTEDATERVDDAAATEGPTRLVALARVYDDYVHVVTRTEGPVRTLADLKGREVAVGQPGSGVELVAGRVLTEAKVRVRKQPLDLVAGARALEAGTVDAVFWSGGLPTGAIADLARRVPVRLVPLDDVAPALRSRYGVAYRPATIPAGSYGVTDPVPTVASSNLLVGRPDADPAVVAALLDTLFRRRDAIAAAVPAANSLDRRTAISTGSLDLHRAAVAYYRRTKP